MRWFVIAGEWAVLLPLWRRLIKNPLWRVPASVFTGIVLFFVTLTVIAIVFGEGTESRAEADRRNLEAIASLSPHPQAHLFETYTFDDFRRVRGIPFNPLRNFRTLTYVYAAYTDQGASWPELLAFYEDTLAGASWQRADNQFGGPYTFVKEDYYLYLNFIGDIPPADSPFVEETRVPGARIDGRSFFFSVSIAHSP